VLALVILGGAVLKTGYQAYGMAGIPIMLIRGTKSLEAEENEISGSIHSVRE
jgi:hypothetical protein